jgi:hypothetical protein
MLDLNNDKDLKKLREAISSEEGQLIIDFIKHYFNELDFKIIDKTQPMDEIGHRFLVIYEIKEKLNSLLELFDKYTLNN